MTTYAIFDIETRIDKTLVRETMFRDSDLTDEQAYEQFRESLIADRGSDFFPLTFHVPISIAVGFVGGEQKLESLESLTIDGSEEDLVREFWSRVEKFSGTLVSFNGRNFDLPVLELHALRYGIAASRYFNERYGHRYRFQQDKHYDLHEFVTNFGAHRVRGGFDALMQMMGLPGKGAIDGSKVQAYWEAGRLDEIHEYCRKDVLQTYFLLLRVEVVRGRMDLGRATELIEEAGKFAAEST